MIRGLIASPFLRFYLPFKLFLGVYDEVNLIARRYTST